MNGNGYKGDAAKEAEHIRFDHPFKFMDPLISLHNVRDAAHMSRLYQEYNEEKYNHRGNTTAYNVDGVKKLRRWILPEYEPGYKKPNKTAGKLPVVQQVHFYE